MGAIHSPFLLLHSGIGDAHTLLWLRTCRGSDAIFRTIPPSPYRSAVPNRSRCTVWSAPTVRPS
ncbi:hypothetical protein IVB48_40100 [Bradyrhizobium sp. 76]|nr:hypothetical protein [Bradyrhizobium sp. 76]